jgi:hypothetical protein
LPTRASVTVALVTARAAAPDARAAAGTRFGLIDGETPTIDIGAVQLIDGLPPIFVGHLHESEPAGTTGIPIAQDLGRGHFADGGKEGAEVVGTEAEGQVAYVYFHDCSLSRKTGVKAVRLPARTRNGLLRASKRA